jgi:hypothetical protein
LRRAPEREHQDPLGVGALAALAAAPAPPQEHDIGVGEVGGGADLFGARVGLAPSSSSPLTREINDGLLAPRFAPSTRAWVLSGTVVTGFKPFAASEGIEDSDDR